MGPAKLRPLSPIIFWIPETPQEAAKQAFDLRDKECVNTFLFGKPPDAIQNDLSVAGKRNATVDEIRDFFPRRY